MSNFKLGDTIQLNSGGPPMTVKVVEGDWVICDWFDGTKKCEDKFLAPTLTEEPGPARLRRLGQPSRRVDFVTGFLRRQYLIILICLLLSAPFAALYLLITPPLFTASATIMMDARRGQLFQQSFLTDAPADSDWVDSQIGILKSQNVALNVVRQLRLADDVEFIQPAPGPLDTALDPVYQRVGWAPDQPKSEAERAAQATRVVEGGLDILRLGLGYLIKIDFRGHNPEQAVKIANSVLDAYVQDQMNSQFQTYRRLSDWLQDRLQTLREQTARAERDVVEFKQKKQYRERTGGPAHGGCVTIPGRQPGADRPQQFGELCPELSQAL
jgi:polysaccharide biosynthesis transport protein